jgi:hypothetical protein
MASCPVRQSGHGGGGTAEQAGDLAVGGTGDECGGDGDEQLGSLEEVGRGERLPRECSSAGRAAESRHGGTPSAGVGAMPVGTVAGPCAAVIGAAASWAERGPEALQSFHGSERCVHEADTNKGRAAGGVRRIEWNCAVSRITRSSEGPRAVRKRTRRSMRPSHTLRTTMETIGAFPAF